MPHCVELRSQRKLVPKHLEFGENYGNKWEKSFLDAGGRFFAEKWLKSGIFRGQVQMMTPTCRPTEGENGQKLPKHRKLVHKCPRNRQKSS